MRNANLFLFSWFEGLDIVSIFLFRHLIGVQTALNQNIATMRATSMRTCEMTYLTLTIANQKGTVFTGIYVIHGGDRLGLNWVVLVGICSRIPLLFLSQCIM